MIVSLQFLLANVLKIPGGCVSDRFGKRKVMILSVLTCAPCTVIFVLSQSFLQATAAALLLIAAGIYYAPAHEALQADLTHKAVRGRIMAIWRIGNAISLALGALVGGFLFQNAGSATPFYLFTITELIAVSLIISTAKNSSTSDERRQLEDTLSSTQMAKNRYVCKKPISYSFYAFEEVQGSFSVSSSSS